MSSGIVRFHPFFHISSTEREKRRKHSQILFSFFCLLTVFASLGFYFSVASIPQPVQYVYKDFRIWRKGNTRFASTGTVSDALQQGCNVFSFEWWLKMKSITFLFLLQMKTTHELLQECELWRKMHLGFSSLFSYFDFDLAVFDVLVSFPDIVGV